MRYRFTNSPFERMMTPVSYTHLFHHVAFDDVEDDDVEKALIERTYCAEAFEPVSYTHLDVYKRQPEGI